MGITGHCKWRNNYLIHSLAMLAKQKTHNEHKGYAEQCIPFIFIINHKNHETNTAVPLTVTISILLLLPIVS